MGSQKRSHLEWPNIHFRNLYSGASKTIAALAAKRNNWDLLLCTRVYCTVLKDGSFCSLYASKIHASLDSYPGPNYVTISTIPFREERSQPQAGLLSTPTVSSVPGEYNYLSAGANVIITAVASRYCNTNCRLLQLFIAYLGVPSFDNAGGVATA